MSDQTKTPIVIKIFVSILVIVGGYTVGFKSCDFAYNLFFAEPIVTEYVWHPENHWSDSEWGRVKTKLRDYSIAVDKRAEFINNSYTYAVHVYPNSYNSTKSQAKAEAEAIVRKLIGE